MEELALHILDIAQNSIVAAAENIEITVSYNPKTVVFEITDDGCGMNEETAKSIFNPFTTSRTTRKIGLGIPLLKESCEQSGGSLELHSKKGTGTKITASFERNSFNRPPLGNIGGTVSALISCNPHVLFTFKFIYEDAEYTISTKELQQVLGNVPVSNPEIAAFIEQDVNSGIRSLCMEDIL